MATLFTSLLRFMNMMWDWDWERDVVTERTTNVLRVVSHIKA